MIMNKTRDEEIIDAGILSGAAARILKALDANDHKDILESVLFLADMSKGMLERSGCAEDDLPTKLIN